MGPVDAPVFPTRSDYERKKKEADKGCKVLPGTSILGRENTFGSESDELEDRPDRQSWAFPKEAARAYRETSRRRGKEGLPQRGSEAARPRTAGGIMAAYTPTIRSTRNDPIQLAYAPRNGTKIFHVQSERREVHTKWSLRVAPPPRELSWARSRRCSSEK